MCSSADAISIWRNLRAPFLLPSSTSEKGPKNTYHRCEWQKIDIDLLGCQICGNIHQCSYGHCTQTIETNDGLVCELSGVVIHTKKFVESEYMDTMVVTGVEMTELQQVMSGDVTHIVTSMLCSNKHVHLKQKALQNALLQTCVFPKTGIMHNNVMQLCIGILTEFSQKKYTFSFFSHTYRLQLIKFAVEHCCRVLQILVRYGMVIKANEIQRLTVGVLYLMRCGVVMDGKQILPCEKALCDILPPEILLLSSFGVHPKYITEMENRLKFCLRHGHST